MVLNEGRGFCVAVTATTKLKMENLQKVISASPPDHENTEWYFSRRPRCCPTGCRRRTAGPASSACWLPLGTYRLDNLPEPRSDPPRAAIPIFQGHYPRPVLCTAGAKLPLGLGRADLMVVLLRWRMPHRTPSSQKRA